jgi:GAF domain-containing protein
MASPRAPANGLERACGAVVGALGASVLLGDAVDGDRLLRWFGGLPAAAPLAGATLVIVGAAHLLRGRLGALPIALGAAAVGVTVAGSVSSLGHPPTSGTTLVGLGSAAAGVVLAELGAARLAQLLAAVSAVVGGVAVLAFLYGDRAMTIARSSFPNTQTAAPVAYGLLGAGLAIFAATPDRGVSAWLTVDSPGRRAVRRLLPAVVGLTLLVAGAGRWLGLERSVGAPRAWAVVMGALVLGLFGAAAVAVPLIDRLTSRARDAELAELRLATALRDARVADLAHDLAGALTIDDVGSAVDVGVTKVVAARAASYGIVDPARRALVVHHGPMVDDPTVERSGTVPLDQRLVITDAAREGRAVLVPDATSYRDRYPDIGVPGDALGGGARAALPLRDRSGATFGSLVIAWDHPVSFDELMPTLTTIAELVAQSVERARLADDLARDARRQAGLATLAESLAGASNLPEVLSSLAERIAAPLDAIDGVVGLIDRGGRRMRRYFRTDTPEGIRALGRVADMSSSSPLVVAARTGEAVLVPSREWVVAERPDQLDAFDATGLGATANLPMRNRDGEVIGAIGIGWGDAVTFDDSTLLVLSTVAELASQTIQRAWLSDERAREAARAARLSQLAEAMAAAATAREVCEVVATDGPAALGAAAVELRVIGSPDELDVDPTDLARADRAGAPVDPPGAGTEETLSVDVPSVDDQRSLGTIHITWPGQYRDDESFRSRLATLVEVVSPTLERVRLAEAEHRLVEDLQARTIRAIPDVAGLEIVGRYEPASAELGMGGDWFEVVELDGGRVGFIVGDVVGHGVASAAEMSQLSAVLGTVLALGTPLEDFFLRVHEVTGSAVPTFVATASVTVLDLSSGDLDHVAAGHPPPIVLAGGVAEPLEGGRAPVVGMAAGRIVPARRRLDPGDALFLYTDGLVERRGEDLDTGLARISEALEAVSGRTLTEQVADLVGHGSGGGQIEDDIALLAVRRI